MDIYEQKKAVVIGGTSGMGYAIVEKLAQGGASVLLTGHNEAKLQAAAQTYPGKVFGFQSDITSMSDIKTLGDSVRQQFGTFDYLFINTGICELEAAEAITEESYDRQFAVNTKGAFFTIQQLLPLINKGGSIVFTSSVADKMGIPAGLVYSASKAALVSMAQVLAAELLPRNIRVNAISVGYADTPSMGIARLSDDERQSFKDDGSTFTPMGRIATVEEFATGAIFLAHDATFVTGINLPFDGGLGLGVFAQQTGGGTGLAAFTQ